MYSGTFDEEFGNFGADSCKIKMKFAKLIIVDISMRNIEIAEIEIYHLNDTISILRANLPHSLLTRVPRFFNNIIIIF